MSLIDKFALFIGVTGVITVVLSVCFWKPAPAKFGPGSARTKSDGFCERERAGLQRHITGRWLRDHFLETLHPAPVRPRLPKERLCCLATGTGLINANP